jgi:hypothetical protein
MVIKIRAGLWIDLSLITRLRLNETSEKDDCYEIYMRDEGYTFYDEEDGKLIEAALEKYYIAYVPSDIRWQML